MGPTDEKPVWELMDHLDIRAVLSAVHVPALVIHRADNPFIRVGHGRYLAGHLPNSRFVELPGADHVFFAGDTGRLLDEIEQFVSGEPHVGHADRVLATILFTDIVRSTELAARLGDRAWRDLLDHHDDVAQREVARHRGRLVKSTGDGVLATFDGPGRAIGCAKALQRATKVIGVELRCGVHTGEVEVRGDDVGGIAVHTAARIASAADAGSVWVSRTVTDLVAGSGIGFEDHGEHELKGVPGTQKLFSVVS
jgi:class 3 adenylate cyclase